MGEKDRGSSWVLVEQDKLLISILLFQCFNQSQIFCQTQKSIFDPVQDLFCWVLQPHQLRQIWFLLALVIPVLMSWGGCLNIQNRALFTPIMTMDHFLHNFWYQMILPPLSNLTKATLVLYQSTANSNNIKYKFMLHLPNFS